MFAGGSQYEVLQLLLLCRLPFLVLPHALQMHSMVSQTVRNSDTYKLMWFFAMNKLF